MTNPETIVIGVTKQRFDKIINGFLEDESEIESEPTEKEQVEEPVNKKQLPYYHNRRRF